MTTDNLKAWLSMQLADDERVTQVVDWAAVYRDPVAAKRRFLAEVDAKRRIIELHEGAHECSVYDHNGEIDNCSWRLASDNCSTVRLLAEPFAAHPDYDERWKP